MANILLGQRLQNQSSLSYEPSESTIKCWFHNCDKIPVWECSCSKPKILICKIHLSAHNKSLKNLKHSQEYILKKVNKESKSKVMFHLERYQNDINSLKDALIFRVFEKVKEIEMSLKFLLKNIDEIANENLKTINKIFKTTKVSFYETDDIIKSLVLSQNESIRILNRIYKEIKTPLNLEIILGQEVLAFNNNYYYHNFSHENDEEIKLNEITVKLETEINEKINSEISIDKYFTRKPIIHWHQPDSNIIHLHNLETNKSNRLTLSKSFKIQSFSRSLLLNDDQILICGGYIDKDLINEYKKAFIISLNLADIIPINDMIVGRKGHWLVYMNKYIYAISGANCADRHIRKCERLSLETFIWESIADLNQPREGPTGVSIKNSIYIIGGRTDWSHYNTSLEIYDLFSNKWIEIMLKIPIMGVSIGCARISNSSNKLLLFGGNDLNIKGINKSYLIDIEKFEIQQDAVSGFKSHAVINESMCYNGKVSYFVFKSKESRDLCSININPLWLLG